MKKKKLLLGIVAALAVLFLAKNLIAGAVVSGAVQAITGLRFSIQKMDLSVLKSRVAMSGLKVWNPGGFPDPIMVEMPELSVSYELGSFFGGKPHLRELRLEVKEFLVEKNARGELNLNALKFVQAKEKQKAAPAGAPSQPPPSMRIDQLYLKIDRVLYKDYSAGSPPRVQEFNVRINERYEQITNPQALGSLILVKALKNTAIARLTNFDIGMLSGDVEGLLRGATSVAAGILDTAGETGKSVGQTAQDAGEKAVNIFKKLLPSGN